ncbi:hypothetical protein APHAL10511_008443 [Amanita phalloides]|nr:hypothetical protein APHAL10511_008443 [Amanita phalloides]
MFKPSQLHTPIRCVGQRGHMDSLPEAQYQDEFYRSVFSATKGNVRISPEFASPKGSRVTGCIDFFIPKMKWGIEILRDGDRLLQHNTRFHEETGAYGAWLRSGEMTDYVLLDCRTNVPQRRHEDIRNLLHAVFDNDFQEVTLYNNQLEKVGETFALVENHL